MIFIVPLPNQVRVLSCHLYIITLENTSMYFQITRKEEFLIMSIIETKPVELIMTPQINYSDSVIYTLADMITHPLNKAVFITLYRCGKYSMVTNALIRAAETMHIPVCVYVETNAAGMKDDNKDLAKYLRKHGCRVVTSPKNILGENKVKKVHFKACMNIADDASSFFYSTGNFSVPQGINSEDICTKNLLNDDPNAFYDMYTIFRRIFNDVFDFDSYDEFILSKRNGTTLDPDWKVLRYIPSTSMRDITSVDEYYDVILNNLPYNRMSTAKLIHHLNNTPTEKHPIVIRMKTRSLSSAPFVTFINKIESLYDMDEIEMHILVKDHIGDGVKDIIKKYPNIIHLYSGKLRRGYNWHSNYCIINDSKLILTSCNTDNWKKRFELAMLIDKYSLTYSYTGVDEHTLVDEFDAEIADSCYEIYTTEPKSFVEDYSYDVKK